MSGTGRASDGPFDLTDRVAVVTGGGAGIGRGIAVQLARCGVDVVVADIDVERAEQTAQLVERQGRRGIAVATDVMDADQVRSCISEADSTFGRLDIMVNNAGGVNGRPFLEQSERSWRRHIDLNLVSMLVATATAAPIMIRGGRGGSIVNVASIEATRAAPNYAVYAACKAGMISFTRTMAVELGEHRIRVNVIAPDLTQTPGSMGLPQGPVPDPLPSRSQETLAKLNRYIPLKREGTMEECGHLAAFLCSDLAGYITGALVPIDGGTSASSGWTRDRSGGWSVFGETPMYG